MHFLHFKNTDWSDGIGNSRTRDEVICNKNLSSSKHLCLPREYNKFDLPFPGTVNTIDIGIDIVDVLRINDKANNSIHITISYYIPS